MQGMRSSSAQRLTVSAETLRMLATSEPRSRSDLGTTGEWHIPSSVASTQFSTAPLWETWDLLYSVAMALPLSSDPWVPEDTFGARLALVRQHKGWNVLEAAEACGITDQTWRNWEAGGSPRRFEEVARKIADASGCSYRWLLVGAGYQLPQKLSRSDLDVHVGGRVGAPVNQQRLRFLQPVPSP